MEQKKNFIFYLLSKKLFFALIFFTFLVPNTYSQTGQELFKKCASCHHPVVNKTGPALKGALQRWKDAGEEDLIYEWIQNPSKLYNSGKSNRAKEVWDYDASVMPAQAVTKDEIDLILTYLDEYEAAPVASAGDGDMQSELSYEIPEESISFWWWVIGGVLAVIIFATMGVRRELNSALEEKNGIEVNTKRTFLISAHEWALRNWFVMVLLIISVAIFGGVELMGRGFQVGVYQDYMPSQPIAYSHKLHAGQMEIDCKYCHNSAEKSKHAGIPSVNVCMNCHNAIHEGAQYGTKEIDKIHTAAGYEKESRSYNLDDYGQRVETPVVWNKAHNLPDHVFFSHAQHVHPNTANIDCRQCHGNVETYTLGRVSTIDEVNAFADTDEGKERKIIKLTKPLLTMGWCIECHNEKEVDLTRPGYYEEIHNRLKKKPSLHNMIFEDEKVTPKELGGWECAKCHY